MSTVKDGKYEGAKIADYGVRPDKNGEFRAWVTFTIQDGDNQAVVQWSNGIETKAINDAGLTPQKITLDNLEKMGYKGGLSGLGVLFDGPESKALNMLLDFDLVMKGGYVQYINLPGEGPGKKFASKADMLAALAKAGVSVGANKNYLGD